MKLITFYSTKIFSEGTLFYKAQELSSQKIIDYFNKKSIPEEVKKSIPKEEVPVFTQSSWWDLFTRYQLSDKAFLELIKEHISSDSKGEPYEKIENEFVNVVKAAPEDQVNAVTYDFWEMSTVIPECLNIMRDEIVEKERLKTEQELSKVYSLPSIQGQGEEKENQYFAYAIKALEGDWKDDENGSKNWIGQLIEAAKELADIKENDDYDIQLVLHDKDLGGIFVTRDVYVLDSEQIKKYTQDPKCHIIFFKHTSNEFVNLLGNNELTSLEIYKEVKNSSAKYSEVLENIKELDRSPYISTEYETKKLIKDLKG